MNSVCGDLYPEITQYVKQRVSELEQIPTDRKSLLEQLSACLRQCGTERRPAALTFICTHNSRRSQFAQIWAQIAAAYYGVEQVTAFSGGTEVTRFHPGTVAALQRCGVRFRLPAEAHPNPHYTISFSDNGVPLIGFSKIFNLPPNPADRYCAIMTCSQADQSCPAAAGCESRLAIPYEDPGSSDGTALESATYNERCAQIAREMLYVMSRVQT